MKAYFDYASTSFRKPKCVYKAVKDYRRFGVGMGRGSSKEADKCAEMVDQTRKMLRHLVGANCNFDVVFQPSATYALNLILYGLDYENIKHVYISPNEHNAVLRPLYALQKRHGFEIITLGKHEQQFNKKPPQLVVISHITNTFGIIQDYEPVFKAAKKHDATTVLDMAQSFGLIETNITKGNLVDAVVFAGHKTLCALSGIGGAIIKNTLKLTDTIQGGTGVDSSSETMPKNRPTRYEPGTQNLLGIMSLYHSCKYLEKLGFKKIKQIEERNFLELKRTLKGCDSLQVIEPDANCTAIIACTIKGYSPDNFTEFFSQNDVAVRTGLQCAPTAHKHQGTHPVGTIRFSVGLFTTRSEFVHLKKVLRKLDRKLGGGVPCKIQ